jgi:nucleotide-binding universal stress UspA family protein
MATVDSKRDGKLHHGGSSALKTILVHLHQDDGSADRLEAVIALARACDAHLHFVHWNPIEAYTVIDAFGTFVSDEIVRILKQQARELRAAVEARLEREPLSWDYQQVIDELAPNLIRCAALADLLVTGREPQEREFGGPATVFLGSVLHRLRTPLLVMTDRCKLFDPAGVAVVTWNGSYEAANALRSAVPLLQFATKVRILCIEEKGDSPFAAIQARDYLLRHHIESDVEMTPLLAETVTQDLLNHAMSRRAQYLVMGAYSHSRAGEYLFGGVTRDLLQSCRIPLLMAR